MSYIKEFRLPNLGDGDGGGRIVEWLVSAGESIREGQLLVEVETDKATVEVPATEAGELAEIVAPADARVVRDQLIARVKVVGSPPDSEQAPVAARAPEPLSAPEAAGTPIATKIPGESLPDQPGRSGRVVSTPVARRRAAEAGVSLHGIQGTGRRGRINLSDVERAVAARTAEHPSSVPSSPAAELRVEEFHVATEFGALAVRRCHPASGAADVTVAFLHGLFAESGVWSATARYLARRGLKTVAIDLPNHGNSPCTATGFPEVVEAISEGLERVASGPLVLCGHSYGGAVAARIAGAGRSELQALLLIAPLGFGTEVNQSFLRGMTYAETMAALSREVSHLAVSKDAIPGKEYLQGLLRHIHEHRDDLDAMCRAVATHGVQQIDLRQDASDCTVQSRLVWGRNDELLPWKHALSAPARAGLHLVPHCGHMPMWEALPLVTGILLELAGATTGIRPCGSGVETMPSGPSHSLRSDS